MLRTNLIFNFTKRSLRAKVIFGVVLPLLLILGIFTAIEYNRLQDVILNQLSALSSLFGQLIEQNLRHEMMKSDPEGIQIILDTIKESEEFQVIYVLDIDGRVVFSPNNESVGMRLDNMHPKCQSCHSLAIDQECK